MRWVWATRGSSLAAAVLIISVGVVIAFTLAARSVFQVGLTARQYSEAEATNLADSVISRTVATILETPSFGSSNQTVTCPSNVVDAPSNAGATLTFDVTSSPTNWSTNNLLDGVSVMGSGGRVVPDHAVHLVGIGTWGGTTVTVETIIHMGLSLAIASSGPIASSGCLYVGGAGSCGTGPAPASIGSNGCGCSAICLGPNTTITGNAMAVGGVKDAPGDLIMGGIEPDHPAISLPCLCASSMDPGPCVQPLPATFTCPAISGFARRAGNLNVPNNLSLCDAVIYVCGNATFSGQVTGTGAIIVNGKTTLLKGAQIQSDNAMAVVSQGDLTIKGQGTCQSLLQGLVYSRGNVAVSNMTVSGSLVANGLQAGGSQMQLQNLSVTHNGAASNTVTFRLGSAVQNAAAFAKGSVLGAATPVTIPAALKPVCGTGLCGCPGVVPSLVSTEALAPGAATGPCNCQRVAVSLNRFIVPKDNLQVLLWHRR